MEQPGSPTSADFALVGVEVFAIALAAQRVWWKSNLKDGSKTRAQGNGAASEDHETLNCPAVTSPNFSTVFSNRRMSLKEA